MARHLSPERRQLKAQAIVLRKMGWSQQKIADQIGVPRTTVTDWFDDNTISNIPVKRYRSDDKTKRVIPVKPRIICGSTDWWWRQNEWAPRGDWLCNRCRPKPVKKDEMPKPGQQTMF